MNVCDYFSTLGPLWEELFFFEPKWVANEDVELRREQMKKRIFFLIFM
jgi:hypothetical protein